MANCFSRPAQMSTRSRGPSSTARARSTRALKFTGAPTSTGSPPCAATRAGVPFVVASTIVLPATTAGTISRGELPSANPSILTLGLALEELGVHAARDEVGMAHDPTEEGNGRGHALNDKRVERLAHAGQRFGPAVAVDDHLREQGVVERGHGVARVDVGVDAHARPARRVVGGDRPR